MNKRRGFTFIETILSVLIVSIIAGVAAKVLITGLDVYALVVNRNNAFQSARSAMDRIEDELVLLKWTDITWMSNTRFGFFDTNGVSTDFEKVNVYKSGRTVPCINRGSDFLAGEVIALDFDYYKDDGTATIWSFEVKRINVDITVQALANAGTVHLRTDIFPRNFMYSNFE